MSVELEAAIRIALTAHAGQLDKGGQPYILHPLRVMLSCKTDRERIVAVLHDALEDSAVSHLQLWEAFGLEVADAVHALTRQDGEAYSEFIERVALNPLARKVKLADLADNMNLDRLGREPTVEDARRQWKYGKAVNVLAWAEHTAQGTEAGTAKTEGLGPKDDGPVPQGCAQTTPGDTHDPQ